MNTKSYEALKFHISTNPASSTFMYEDELPDLPVPSLDDTLQRLVLLMKHSNFFFYY